MSDKPHLPTQKRLKEARKEGKILKSQLLIYGISVLLFALVFDGLVRYYWVRLRLLVEYCLEVGIPGECAKRGAHIAAESLAVVVGFGILSLVVHFVQVGWLFEPGLLSIKLDRINPLAGLRRVFGGFKKAWRTIFLVSIYIAFIVCSFGSADLLSMFTAESSGELFAFLNKVLFGSSLVFICLGGIEYFLNRKAYYKELSMSNEELRQEHKNDEGDPYAKSMRSAMHRNMMTELVKQVRRAKVIIVE